MAAGYGDSWAASNSDASSASSRPRKGAFEDIVEERRQHGELRWVLRTRHGVPHPEFCAATPGGSEELRRSRDALKRAILQSDKVLYGLREISLETGRPMPELLKEAESVLEEMSHSLNMFSVRSFGFAVAKVMKRLYRAVYVNTEGIAQLRKACSQYPVILMPMHRSYADFLLLSLICFDYDLPLPAIASAMDFMGMKFIGSVLRNCGAFFIRRSFATDRVYWLTFVEYVKAHVRDGLAPVEFFIEGTRSRSGKTLYPKTGMLGAILESWFMCEVPDVYLVPVSISYDRILEEKLYAYELLGVPKPKESTSGLLKARSLLAEDFGSVHFYFDEPVSLRQFASGFSQVDRGVHSLAPKVKAQLTDAEIRMLKEAARHVVNRQCSNAVVSPFCLIAALLLEESARSGADPISLSADRLTDGLAWLRRQLTDELGVRVDWPAGADEAAVIADQCQLHADLVTRLEDGGLALASGAADAAAGAGGGDGGGGDDSGLTEAAAVGLRLASYRNPLMCHLIGPAVSQAAAALPGGSAAANYDLLKRLLHREFPTIPEEFVAATHAPPGAAAGHNRQRRHRLAGFLTACLTPFLAGYWLMCDTLMATNSAPAAAAAAAATPTDRQMALRAQARGLEILKNGGAAMSYLVGWDCLSLDLLANAAHSLRRLRSEHDSTSLASLRSTLEQLITSADASHRPTLEASPTRSKL